jgi:hypothetical protein
MLVTDGGPSSLTRYVRDDGQRSALRRSALRAVRRDTAVTAESAWCSAFAVRVAGSRRPAASARRCTSARVSGRAMASSSHSRRRREKNAHILRVPSSSRKVLRRYPRCPGLSTAQAPASPVARDDPAGRHCAGSGNRFAGHHRVVACHVAAAGHSARRPLRGGIFTTSIPAPARTASKAEVNCPARSRTRIGKPAAGLCPAVAPEQSDLVTQRQDPDVLVPVADLRQP